MNEIIEEHKSEHIEIFSIKLINGVDVLSEIILPPEEDESDTFIMINPVIFQMLATNKGEMTMAKEYDPFSCEDMFNVPFEMLISEPTIASKFYRDFYVHTLMHQQIRRVKDDINSWDLDKAELNAVVKEYNYFLLNYAKELTEKYGVVINEIPTSSFIFPAHETIQ